MIQEIQYWQFARTLDGTEYSRTFVRLEGNNKGVQDTLAILKDRNQVCERYSSEKEFEHAKSTTIEEDSRLERALVGT